jgi:hypothetical protein
MKHRGIEQQSDRLVESLRMGGKQALQGISKHVFHYFFYKLLHFPEHIRGLHELIDYYDQEARECHQRREAKKADLYLTKKKLAMKEVILT